MDMTKNKKNREIISKVSDAVIKHPCVLNIVSSATRAFAEEAIVEVRTLQTDTADSGASDMAIKDRSKKQEKMT